MLAGILALTGSAAPLAAQDGPNLATRLGTTLEDVHDRHGVPGATAAIALPDGTVATAAVGLADVETERAMTPDTPMRAASVGETFVAATVLALESEGLLSRADLASVRRGDRPWSDTLPDAGTMTIGQLPHHTAGIPDHVHLPAFRQAWADLAMREDRFDPEDLIRFLSGLDPLVEPGTARAYSDTGYVLLGLVIAAVTGERWQDAVRAGVLGPLGLTETVPPDRPDLPGLAVGYVAPDNPFGMPVRTADAEGRLLWNPAVEAAGGGFAATSRDLARWGHLLFGGAAMAEPCLERLLDGVPLDPDAPGILHGAGVAICEDTPRGAVWGHGGWIPAYVSSLRHHADHGVTVAVQINPDAGVMDDTSDLVPALEAALADLAIGSVAPGDRP